jgi:hypothetical protein
MKQRDRDSGIVRAAGIGPSSASQAIASFADVRGPAREQ